MKDLQKIKEALLCLLEDYYKGLQENTAKDKKARTAEYYLFCEKLLSELDALEKFAYHVSENIKELDAKNKYAERDALSKAFESSLSIRRITEEFLRDTEEIFKSDYSDYLYAARRDTDTAIRKIYLIV